LTLELIVAGTATSRLLGHTPAVDGLPVLIISGIAALAMTAGALVLQADADDGDGDSPDHPSRTTAVRPGSRCHFGGNR
jgi:hypothetical protein